MLRRASKVVERGGYVGGEVLGEIDVALVDQGGGVRFPICILHDIDMCVAGSEVTHEKRTWSRNIRYLSLA